MTTQVIIPKYDIFTHSKTGRRVVLYDHDVPKKYRTLTQKFVDSFKGVTDSELRNYMDEALEQWIRTGRLKRTFGKKHGVSGISMFWVCGR